MIFRHLTIKKKVLLFIGTMAFIGVSITSTLISYRLHQMRQADAKIIIENLFNYYVHLLQDEFEIPTHQIEEIEQLSGEALVNHAASAELQTMLNSINIVGFNRAYTTIYNLKGIVIASNNQSYVGQPIEKTTDNQILIDHVLKQQPLFYTRYSRTLNETVISYVKPVAMGKIKWMVAVNIPAEQHLNESRTLYSFIFGITYVSAIIAMWLLAWVLSGFTRSLNQAVTITKAIATGHLDNSITWHGQDEIAQFFQALAQMQTQLREQIEQDKQIAQAAIRINQALNNVSTSVLIANNDYQIIYANPAAHQLLADIRTQSPGFQVDQFLNMSIDNFHPAPNQFRQVLRELRTVQTMIIMMGELTLQLTVNLVKDEQGQRLGWVFEFKNKSLEVATERQINSVIATAALGDYSKRVDLTGNSGFFHKIGEGINQVLDHKESILGDIRRVMGALSNGDLTQTINKDYQGLLKLIQEDINATVNKFITVIATIMETAYAVSQATEELAEGNHNLSQRTEQQAASLQQTAASMEQMTGTIQQTTDHARRSAHLAMQARNYAQEGGKVVNQAVDAMSEINQSSKQVGDIIGLINDIAFQTNLLALNAAVEAARAGEQGRGFAVVAAEVRNLAQRSAGAAKEIKILIDNSMSRVAEGTQLVNQSGLRLKEIITAVKEVSDIIVSIAAASQEQLLGIQQVNKAISQMDEMTQQNAAMVEEAAVASACLKEQAQHLQEGMSFFKIGKM